MSAEKKLPKVWYPPQEMILKSWGEAAACYRFMHYQSFLKYRKSNMRFTLPVIVLSTLTGTANFAQEQFPPNLKPYVAPTIGGMNLVAGLIATIAQFLKVSELMESHRVAAMTYGKFSRTIRLELALPLSERTKDGSFMIEDCRAEYDRLIEQSPPIPSDILNAFEKEFPYDNKFYKPEIMHIQPIKLYSAIKENQLVSKITGMIPTNKTKDELMKEVKEIRNSGMGKITAPVERVRFDLEQQKKERDAELEALRSQTKVSLVKQNVTSELQKRVAMMATEVPAETPPPSPEREMEDDTEALEEVVTEEPPENSEGEEDEAD
jgi:hypothetical protein